MSQVVVFPEERLGGGRKCKCWTCYKHMYCRRKGTAEERLENGFGGGGYSKVERAVCIENSWNEK